MVVRTSYSGMRESVHNKTGGSGNEFFLPLSVVTFVLVSHIYRTYESPLLSPPPYLTISRTIEKLKSFSLLFLSALYLSLNTISYDIKIEIFVSGRMCACNKISLVNRVTFPKEISLFITLRQRGTPLHNSMQFDNFPKRLDNNLCLLKFRNIDRSKLSTFRLPSVN